MGFFDWLKGIFSGSIQEEVSSARIVGRPNVKIVGRPLKLICSVKGLADFDVPILNNGSEPSLRMYKKINTGSLRKNNVGEVCFCYDCKSEVFYVYLYMNAKFKKFENAEGFRAHLAFQKRGWNTQVNDITRIFRFETKNVPYRENYFADCSIGANNGEQIVYLNFSIRFEY